LYSLLLNLPKLILTPSIGIPIQNESGAQFICDVENNFKISSSDICLWLIREYLIYNEDGLKNMGVKYQFINIYIFKYLI